MLQLSGGKLIVTSSQGIMSGEDKLGDQNNLVNGLLLRFDGKSEPWTVKAVLTGVSEIDNGLEEVKIPGFLLNFLRLEFLWV